MARAFNSGEAVRAALLSKLGLTSTVHYRRWLPSVPQSERSVLQFLNRIGIRAYEKAGFKEIGRRRECRVMGGEVYDEIYMDCLASEFESPALGRIFAPDGLR